MVQVCYEQVCSYDKEPAGTSRQADRIPAQGIKSIHAYCTLSIPSRERGVYCAGILGICRIYVSLRNSSERLFALRKIHLEQQGVRDGVLALKKQLSIASLRPLTINPDIRNPDPSFPSRL